MNGSMRTARRLHGARRAFSLAEILLAVMILAIGLISIGALFPAAIFQQRLSTDDATGPLVAENAFSTLRNKLRPDMFGTTEELISAFGGVNNLPNGLYPAGGFPPGFMANGDWLIQSGDWEWKRPAFLLNSPDSTIPVGSGVTATVPRGSIAIFRNGDDASWGPNVTASEVPWNPAFLGVNPGANPALPFGNPPLISAWGAFPQPVIFRPEERAYPQVSGGAGVQSRPTYRWEVMFRRYQGRILAAVFVFRVGSPGGEYAAYAPAANAAPLDPTLPPIPVRVQAPVPLTAVPPSFELPSFAPWLAGGPDEDPETFADNAKAEGTQAGSPFDIADPRYGWQATGQWLVDQNNIVHRVQRGRRSGTDDWVLLSKPVPLLPDVASYVRRKNNPVELPSVLGLWFMPRQDANGNSLTPIYVTVKELF